MSSYLCDLSELDSNYSDSNFNASNSAHIIDLIYVCGMILNSHNAEFVDPGFCVMTLDICKK